MLKRTPQSRLKSEVTEAEAEALEKAKPPMITRPRRPLRDKRPSLLKSTEKEESCKTSRIKSTTS